ncbi:MAG: hypothetical protein E4H17_03490, partial [Gemmatimonadales bacterium]
MTELTIHAGICGFVTTVRTDSPDGGLTVAIDFDTTCSHVAKARAALASVDPMVELFRKLHDTAVYAALSPHLPHVACPVHTGFLKAIEVA